MASSKQTDRSSSTIHETDISINSMKLLMKRMLQLIRISRSPQPGITTIVPPDGDITAWLVVLGAWCILFCSFGWINSMLFPHPLPYSRSNRNDRHRDISELLRDHSSTRVRPQHDILDSLAAGFLHVWHGMPQPHSLRKYTNVKRAPSSENYMISSAPDTSSS
jgi:hypothetical protein